MRLFADAHFSQFPKVETLYREAARHLRSAAVMSAPQANADALGSVNGSRTVMLSAGGQPAVKSVVKLPAEERGGLPGLRLGELYLNEVDSSRLAQTMGVEHLVTQAIDRTLDGGPVAVQLWHQDTIRADAPAGEQRFHRPSAEILRVVDYVLGNLDRRGRNVLVRPVDAGPSDGTLYLPLGIDYGGSLPRGPILGHEQVYPSDWVVGHEGPLLDATTEFIRQLDPRALLETASAAAAAVAVASTEHMLRRVARVKRDASFLAINGAPLDDVRAMSRATTTAGAQETQALGSSELSAIGQSVKAEYARRAAQQFPDGTLLRQQDNGAIFLLGQGLRWHVPNPETFTRLGLQPQAVRPASLRTLEAIPVSATMQ